MTQKEQKAAIKELLYGLWAKIKSGKKPDKGFYNDFGRLTAYYCMNERLFTKRYYWKYWDLVYCLAAYETARRQRKYITNHNQWIYEKLYCF